jgi:endonuclease/exonuclease/phosphatase family metal-dependent hydrolase
MVSKFRIVLLVAVATFVLALPAVAVAKADGNSENVSAGGPKATVMTRNIFLGADLNPALAATTIDGAIDGSGVIWNELLSTNFPERAVPLAREIKASGADLVGLQEVALWRQQIPSDLGAPPTGVGQPATQVKFDFLALLMQELDAIGGNYEVVHVQQEFDAELPADLDQSNATGSPPFGAELDGRLTMRDVILHKRDSKVQLVPGSATGANYQTKFTPLIAGAIPLPVNRGWNSVEATINGGREFRFVNTHLEAFGDDTIREAQAKELFATGGPLDTQKQVILVGDLNSGTEARDNIHGTDQLAYSALLGFGMTENGAVQSCCYDSLFDPAQVFDHTVDHVMTKPALKTQSASITGNDPSQRTPSGLWPSDHGGVVSTVHIRK